MLNPKYRGKQFKYKTFDIARAVEAHIGTSVPWDLTDKERKTAGECATRRWNEWVELAGEGLPEVLDDD